MCDFLVDVFVILCQLVFTSCVSWLFSIAVPALIGVTRYFLIASCGKSSLFSQPWTKWFLPAKAHEYWPHAGVNCLVCIFASTCIFFLTLPHACPHRVCAEDKCGLVSGCSFITTIYIWVQNQSAFALRAKSLPQIASNSHWRRARDVHCLVWPRFRQ